MDEIHDVLNRRKEDDELHTELTRTDIIKCIQSERVRFRGVNLCGLDLSKLVISWAPHHMFLSTILIYLQIAILCLVELAKIAFKL